MDVVKEGAKRHADVVSRQISAREAAIELTRISAKIHRESARKAAEARLVLESNRLQAQIQCLFQAVHNHILASIKPPALDAFIRTLHSQTPIPQVTHQNAPL